MKYNTFARYGRFWAFGDNQIADEKQVVLLIVDQKLTIKPELPEFLEEYGQHIWISPDKNEGVILAISSLSRRDPVQGTIEFYRIMQENGSYS